MSSEDEGGRIVGPGDMEVIVETTTRRIVSPMTKRVLSGRRQTRNDIRQATFKLLGMVCTESDERNHLIEEN